MFEEQFYQRIVQLRMGKGVSAREMSLAIGQSPGYLNHIENQKGFPSMAAFFEICRYLDITPQEFFDADAAAPKQANALYHKLKRLSPEQIRSVEALIDSFSK